jgi:hypothetical protein
LSNFTVTAEARLKAKVESIYKGGDRHSESKASLTEAEVEPINKGGLVLPHKLEHSKKELLILLLPLDVALQHFWAN